MLAVLGSDGIVKGNFLYLDRTSKKWKKALADGALQPALACAVEAGDTDDEIRVQRIGTMYRAAWKFKAGYPVYLSPTYAGNVTHHRPGSNVQYLGWAYDYHTLFIDLRGLEDFAVFTTTTSSTTTTTTTIPI